MLALTLRLIASLAVVIGLMLLLARFAGHRMRGSRGSVVQVLHRQPLSRSAGVAVVMVGDRVLVLGTTEQNVNLITELDPEALLAEDADLIALPDLITDSSIGSGDLAARVPVVPAEHLSAATRSARHRAAESGALGGSILAPATWRQAVAALTGRAS